MLPSTRRNSDILLDAKAANVSAFLREPVEKSSRTVTVWPRRSNSIARLDPMKPHPPVMRKRCLPLLRRSCHPIESSRKLFRYFNAPASQCVPRIDDNALVVPKLSIVDFVVVGNNHDSRV